MPPVVSSKTYIYCNSSDVYHFARATLLENRTYFLASLVSYNAHAAMPPCRHAVSTRREFLELLELPGNGISNMHATYYSSFFRSLFPSFQEHAGQMKCGAKFWFAKKIYKNTVIFVRNAVVLDSYSRKMLLKGALLFPRICKKRVFAFRVLRLRRITHW